MNALATLDAPVAPVVRRSDRAFDIAVGAAAGVVLLLLATLVLVLVRASAPALAAFGPTFVLGREWDPVREQFGALPFVIGTLASSAIGLMIAVPIGIGSAIFVAEIAGQLTRRVLALLLDLLAAVPSVIYGLWGVFVLAPFVRYFVEPALHAIFHRVPLFGALVGGPQIGVSILAAGLILAIIVLPYIAAVSREALLQVPRATREAALAIGATRWETIRVAVVPSARSGLVGACFLGLGRALGETMAVTMVIGNSTNMPTSLFSPGHSIASSIANEFAEATSDTYLAALCELGLILLVVTSIVNAVARLLVRRLAPHEGRRAE